MAKELFAFVENKEGACKKASLEAVSAACALQGAAVTAIVFGSGALAAAEELKEYGVDKVRAIGDAALDKFTAESYAAALAGVLPDAPFLLVLGNSAVGRELAPRLAAKLDAAAAVDTTEIALDGDTVLVKKPIYAGKAFAREALTAAKAIVTLRPNSVPIAKAAGKAEVVASDLSAEAMHTLVKEIVEQSGGRVELTEADIIVSGGRGMKAPENFKVLEELADVLHAAVGASRAAVDSGWREHSDQVGQTGKVVSPALYIACGISGAIQHLAGMSSSKCIVAINEDPEANIFNVADYGIVGDLFEVVPALEAEFKKQLA